MQTQRCCIVGCDAGEAAYAIRHEADVLREMCHPAEAEPLYLEAVGIYRQLDEKDHA
jgi:hypothetical protein